MSGTATPLPLAEAEAIAAELARLLEDVCERLEVAGSIRRRRSTVGDVELVCVPKFRDVSAGLFGDQVERISLLDVRCETYLANGVFAHRRSKVGLAANGERYKRLLYRGVPLDLFICDDPDRWGLALLIRTGDAGFSHRLVTSRNIVLPGLGQGWMPQFMRCKDGVLWCHGEKLSTPEEIDVFRALGREFVPPEERNT